MGGYPWSLTLRQFLEKVERDFGGLQRSFLLVGPRGQAKVSFLVRSPEQFAVVLEIDPDEELTPSNLRSLCRQLGIPPDLFGLEEEEPYLPDIN